MGEKNKGARERSRVEKKLGRDNHEILVSRGRNQKKKKQGTIEWTNPGRGAKGKTKEHFNEKKSTERSRGKGLPLKRQGSRTHKRGRGADVVPPVKRKGNGKNLDEKTQHTKGTGWVDLGRTEGKELAKYKGPQSSRRAGKVPKKTCSTEGQEGCQKMRRNKNIRQSKGNFSGW